MTDRRPQIIRQIDDTARELDQLAQQALTLVAEISADLAELERLQRVATNAKLANTILIIEAGSALIRERRAERFRAMLQ